MGQAQEGKAQRTESKKERRDGIKEKGEGRKGKKKLTQLSNYFLQKATGGRDPARRGTKRAIASKQRASKEEGTEEKEKERISN